MNGDLIVFGLAPRDVESVQLVLESETVELPIANHGFGQVAFAVPISHRLDPSAVDLLDGSNDVIGTIELSGLPPFLISPIVGAVRLGDRTAAPMDWNGGRVGAWANAETRVSRKPDS